MGFSLKGAELGLNPLNSGEGAVLKPPRVPRLPEERRPEFPVVEELGGGFGEETLRRRLLGPQCLAD